MQDLIDRLLESLEEQSVCCGQLLELSREKKDVIVQNDITALRRITRVENALIARNSAAERAGGAAMKDLAAAYAKDPAEFAPGELAGILREQPERNRVIDAMSGVRETIEELHLLNGRNRLLIENSLSYIDFSVNLLKDAVCGEPFFMASGEEMPRVRGFFDVSS